MKITKRQLKQIIKEEYVRLKIRGKLNENDYKRHADNIVSGRITSDVEQPGIYKVSLQKGDRQLLKQKRVPALVRGNKFDDAPIQLAFRIYDLLTSYDQQLISPKEIEAAIKNGDIR